MSKVSRARLQSASKVGLSNCGLNCIYQLSAPKKINITRNVQNQVEHIKGKVSSHENKTHYNKESYSKTERKASAWRSSSHSHAATAMQPLQHLTPVHLPETGSVQNFEDCCKVSKQVLGTDCGREHGQRGASEGASSSTHSHTGSPGSGSHFRSRGCTTG